jgi:hypothetical protein
LLAIAFGMLIVMLVVGGSLWMTHLNSQRMPMYQIVQMQRWRLATSQCWSPPPHAVDSTASIAC